MTLMSLIGSGRVDEHGEENSSDIIDMTQKLYAVCNMRSDKKIKKINFKRSMKKNFVEN